MDTPHLKNSPREGSRDPPFSCSGGVLVSAILPIVRSDAQD
jgi:hypothetical protein